MNDTNRYRVAPQANKLQYDEISPLLRFSDRADSTCPLCSPYRRREHQQIKCLRLWRLNDHAISFHCIHCFESGVCFRDADYQPVDPVKLAKAREAAAGRQLAEENHRKGKARDTWRQAVPGKGTLAERYFARRGLEVPDALWRQIRFSDGLFFGRIEKALPAVILPMRQFDGADKLFAVHCIALNSDASNYKVDGHSFKISRGLLLGKAAIMTAPASSSLCVCEGFETGLGVIMGDINEGAPVWATTGAEFLREVPVIEGVHRLIIAADNDRRDKLGKRAGSAAARVLKRRWLTHADVETVFPFKEGEDFADVFGVKS